MTFLRYFCLLMATTTLTTFAPSASAQEQSQLLDRVVALVNEGVVLQSELDAQVMTIKDRIQQSGQPMPPEAELRSQILERLIVTRLQLQRAERMGIQISDEMLNNALAEVAQRNGVQFEQLPEIMAAQGLSYPVYREDMREQLTIEQVRQISVIRRISVTERELEQCLSRTEEQKGLNAEYSLSHMLISVSGAATANEFRAAQEKARSLYDQLQNGADFATLALTNSDSETALEGGSLGWRKGNQIPTLFADAVYSMDAGEVSEPIRSGSGFHLVKLNEVRGAVGRSEIEQTNVRHILIRPNEILDDAAAKQKLIDIRARIIEGEDFSDLAKLNSDDPGSGNLGGDLGWTEPGVFVPEFSEVVDNLELNELSDVVQTRFGYHVIEVLGRRMYDNTEEVRRNECALSLRNARVGEETELWLRRLRDEAFVDKRI
ncbi:MAG: peptidylprolyl isomerase [Pseudomonadota bacterium]